MDIEVMRIRLKNLREENNLKQDDLAAQLHISRSTIAGYETGKTMPSLDIIDRYAEIFNTTVDYIIGRSNQQKENLIFTEVNDMKVTHDNNIKITSEVIELLTKAINKIKYEDKGR